MQTLTKLYENFHSDIHKFEMKLKSMGYDVLHENRHGQDFTLKILLPDGKGHVPDDIKALQDTLRGFSNLLMVDAAVGYDTGNFISFIFPDIKRTADIVYHVTSKRNIDSIMEKGLLKSRATDESDTIIQHDTDEAFRDRKYRAVFVTTSIKDAEDVRDMFDFTEPQLLTIDGKGLLFYVDPMMPDGMDSLVHFKDIKPNRIISVKPI